jgi:hypothetical protein
MEFQFRKALRSLRFAIVAPERLCSDPDQRALPTFAVATLVTVIVLLAAAYVKNAIPELQPQLQQWSQGVPQSPQAHKFTAALGIAIIQSVVSIIALSGLLMVLMRFLTNASVTYSAAVIAVSGCASIANLGTIVNTAISIGLHNVNAALGPSAFVDPTAHGIVSMWLSKANAFVVWEYVSVCIGLASCSGLHSRFGMVVGVVAWIVVMCGTGAASLVVWVTSGAR